MKTIKLDWFGRDALRKAAQRDIWRDIHTKRGVYGLCKLGLLKVTKTTRTRAFYAITEAGRKVAAQLPTLDEEWNKWLTSDSLAFDDREYQLDEGSK